MTVLFILAPLLVGLLVNMREMYQFCVVLYPGGQFFYQRLLQVVTLCTLLLASVKHAERSFAVYVAPLLVANITRRIEAPTCSIAAG